MVPAMRIIFCMLALSSCMEVHEAMNGNEKLPGDHFWDAEEAEREYFAIGQAITEAEEKLKQAQTRLHTVQAVYDRFSGTPGVAAVVRRAYETEENILKQLNQLLNPYRLPE